MKLEDLVGRILYICPVRDKDTEPILAIDLETGESFVLEQTCPDCNGKGYVSELIKYHIAKRDCERRKIKCNPSIK